MSISPYFYFSNNNLLLSFLIFQANVLLSLSIRVIIQTRNMFLNERDVYLRQNEANAHSIIIRLPINKDFSNYVFTEFSDF